MKAIDLAIVDQKLDNEVDKETIELRRSACNSCEFKKGDKCSVCGCYVDLKIMSKINKNKFGKKEITHCPKGRWGDKYLAIYYSLIN